MTVEELIAMGFDKESAEQLVKAQGGGGGTGLPFPVLKINYDTKDILIDHGVKKGELISGWKIDSKTLSVSEEGEVIPQPLEFFIVASVYQKSYYDTASHSTKHITNIYYDPFDTKKQIDIKTGKTVEEVEALLGKKMKFNNIWLIMAKVNDEWKPYIVYMHGTNYYKWGEQLSELGIDPNSVALKYVFKVSTKKIPTSYNPAWVFIIDDAIERSIENIAETAKITSEAIKKFTNWINSSNQGSSVVSEEEAETVTTAPADTDEEINFES